MLVWRRCQATERKRLKGAHGSCTMTALEIYHLMHITMMCVYRTGEQHPLDATICDVTLTRFGAHDSMFMHCDRKLIFLTEGLTFQTFYVTAESLTPFAKLWEVVKILLIFNHSRTWIERWKSLWTIACLKWSLKNVCTIPLRIVFSKVYSVFSILGWEACHLPGATAMCTCKFR